MGLRAESEQRSRRAEVKTIIGTYNPCVIPEHIRIAHIGLQNVP